MAEILIIDDDKVICDILANMMGGIGHRTRYALTGKAGVELSKNGMFDIVFLDVNLPDANGLDLIKTIKSAAPSSPEIIIITGDSDPDGAEMAINSGAWSYLGKPFLRQDLNLQVSRALQFRKEKGNVSCPGMLKRNGVIGESEEIKSCLDMAAIAAYSDTHVLIRGEPGTGKELFAKIIHLNSDRCENNFVILDCSATNENIVESMLFGSVDKALPGVAGNKTGVIENADKGTLFIDEISDLPLQVQGSLLRSMEHLIFTPLGEDIQKTSNFRVIATTSCDLDALSEQGKFRKDLLYSLKGITLNLPSLRSIPDDKIKLAVYYIDQCCKKYGIQPKGISPEFMDIVTVYEWPGNVREMINSIERAVASAKNEPMLYSIHLPAYIKANALKQIVSGKTQEAERGAERYVHGNFPRLKEVMADAEKAYLKSLFSFTRGNVKTACEISGLSRSGMYTRLAKYNIHRE